LILTLGIACFALPYTLLAAPAGYLADRFTKRTVLARCMLLQAGLIVFGMVSILIGNAFLVFLTLGLMGAQGALLAPARLGIIPETVREERISAANGILGMASVFAAVVGTVLGNELYVLTAPVGKKDWWISGATMIAIALLGWAACLPIIKRRAADPKRSFPKHLFRETFRDFRVFRDRLDLLAAASGSAYLWFLAALAQVNIYLLATTKLHISQSQVGPLLAILAGGVGLGSILAGVWSAGRVDTGLTPLGAAGLVISAVAMFFVTWVDPSGGPLAYYWSCGSLFLMGVSAGLYDIPLVAYLQDYTEQRTRGKVLAAGNFLIFAGMLAASGLFWLLTSPLGLSAPHLFLLAAIVTAIVGGVSLYIVGRRTVDTLLRPLRGLAALVEHKHEGTEADRPRR
jgi:acyl-[acyl-carrier-protein]-phospholipid O-acyltransferase / long-chain-fatty-acid--[acyl-carrier-protein] ligase